MIISSILLIKDISISQQVATIKSHFLEIQKQCSLIFDKFFINRSPRLKIAPTTILICLLFQIGWLLGTILFIFRRVERVKQKDKWSKGKSARVFFTFFFISRTMSKRDEGRVAKASFGVRKGRPGVMIDRRRLDVTFHPFLYANPFLSPPCLSHSLSNDF